MAEDPLIQKPSDDPKSSDIFTQLNDTTRALLQHNAEAVESIQKALNTAESRFLNYFWNSSRHCLRQKIPFAVLVFLECDTLHPTLSDVRASELRVISFDLQQKGYVAETNTNGTDYIELTTQGAVYLTQKHPTVLMYWERLLKLMPAWVSFLVALIGFFASIFGIIQFFDWIRHVPK
jgi:hypothetical protein